LISQGLCHGPRAGKAQEKGNDAIQSRRIGLFGGPTQAGLNMVSHDMQAGLVQRSPRGKELGSDRLALATLFDHPLDAAYLPLDTPQARQDLLLLAFCRLIRHNLPAFSKALPDGAFFTRPLERM
jgi:hypothetical protein